MPGNGIRYRNGTVVTGAGIVPGSGSTKGLRVTSRLVLLQSQDDLSRCKIFFIRTKSIIIISNFSLKKKKSEALLPH